MTTATTAAPGEPDGAVSQSIRIGFAALRIATLTLALAWLVSNIRQVPADQQAIVLRFGQVVRVQPAGLVIALPRPIETVVLLPSAERQLGLKLDAGSIWGPAIIDPASRLAGDVVPASAGLYLTGDGGVVLLDAALSYRIDDAAGYFLAASHVEPALQRIFRAAAVGIAAGRSLDDFLVVHTEHTGGELSIQARREAVRGDLVRAMNLRLEALTRAGAGLGVTVSRIDLTAVLPPSAKFAFDAVLDATQMAEQGLATARTEAARIGQTADQSRDSILAGAHASAEERVRGAEAQVAAITSLEQGMDPASRPSLFDQVYRERIAGILKKAGGVDTIDPRGGSRLILQGLLPP